VLAMEKIGRVLAKQDGPLRIYGHTDARQYKSGSGDNWQLSSQRALAAYYMLGRAGLNAGRVTQISGFADRAPREAANPNADVNRRIELFLEVK
jgi:chemotaxis protein MotB